MTKTTFAEAMEKIRASASAPLENGYIAKKSDENLLSETVTGLTDLRSLAVSLSIVSDVHLALHWLVGWGAPETVMASPELFYYLCKARAVKYEDGEEISISELEAWAKGDALEVLEAHKDLWEA